MLSILLRVNFVTAILLLALPESVGANLPNNLSIKPITSQQNSPLLARGSAEDADRLRQQGMEQLRLGEFSEALETYKQVLEIREELGDKLGIAETLTRIGETYINLSQYDEALASLNKALTIQREITNRSGEGETLNYIGFVYRKLGKYSQSLELHQQALEIGKKTSDSLRDSSASRTLQGESLHNLAAVSSDLGDYEKALGLYQQALAIRSEVGDKAGEGRTLNNLAGVYDAIGNSEKALSTYQQALAIRRELGDKAGVGRILNNLGLFYRQQAEYERSLEFYKQAFEMLRETGDRASISSTLNSLGALYESISQYPEALASYQQALVIAEEIGDKAGARKPLSNIGYLLALQDRPELAIFFYKQAVNITETIRQELQGLSRQQQQSYAANFADTYRSLADLLLKQNRVLEAQQVLDLLKVQEIDDYLHNVRLSDRGDRKIELLPSEQKVQENYAAVQDKAIQQGKELAELRKIPDVNRTLTQQNRIAELVKAQEGITANFNEFIRSKEVLELSEQLSPNSREQTLSLRRLKNIQDNLQRLGKGAVLFYPLILEDRLELILTTPDSPPIRRTVSVKREEINRAIVEFRNALEDPETDAKIPAQKLYNWLIKPIENDLNQASAKTIIYAPDSQLRYIPLAALYDGNRWLVQRFAINLITAESLTDFNAKPQDKPRVLAAGFTRGSYNFQVGDREVLVSGLPYAGIEIENLVRMIPNSTKFLDNDFSRDAIIPRMNDYNIVHFATHAAFVVGQPEDSLIFFGNGDRVTLREVENWRLTNVDLMVLSACETGLGGKLGNGEEILGFGYLMEQAGARSAIASLWSVDDGGTQTLMNAFYAALQNGNIAKAEALRQAMVALITGDYTTLGTQRGIAVQQRTRDILSQKVSDRLSHPFYWAPFILIGNGL